MKKFENKKYTYIQIDTELCSYNMFTLDSAFVYSSGCKQWGMFALHLKQQHISVNICK